MLHIHHPHQPRQPQQHPEQPQQQQHHHRQHHTPDPHPALPPPPPPPPPPPAAACSRLCWGWGPITSSKLQLVKVLLLITLCSSLVPAGMTKRAAGKPYSKHFVIHVPMKIRTHHHMHTVFTHMQGVGKGVGGGGEGGGSESGKGTKQTIYKIMGYSTHHTSAGLGGGRGGGGGAGGGGGGGGYGRGFGHGGHGHGHGFGHTYGKQGHRVGGYGEINYDDYTNTDCDDSLAHGDMIFNHYSRQDEEYPEVEELIEDEREGDEWE